LKKLSEIVILKKGIFKLKNSYRFQVIKKDKVYLEKLTDVGVLTPYDNQFHLIEAEEDSIFFDILIPYYDPTKYIHSKKYYHVEMTSDSKIYLNIFNNHNYQF